MARQVRRTIFTLIERWELQIHHNNLVILDFAPDWIAMMQPGTLGGSNWRVACVWQRLHVRLLSREFWRFSEPSSP
jgi:hypothetical protein